MLYYNLQSFVLENLGQKVELNVTMRRLSSRSKKQKVPLRDVRKRIIT